MSFRQCRFLFSCKVLCAAAAASGPDQGQAARPCQRESANYCRHRPSLVPSLSPPPIMLAVNNKNNSFQPSFFPRHSIPPFRLAFSLLDFLVAWPPCITTIARSTVCSSLTFVCLVGLAGCADLLGQLSPLDRILPDPRPIHSFVTHCPPAWVVFCQQPPRHAVSRFPASLCGRLSRERGCGLPVQSNIDANCGLSCCWWLFSPVSVNLPAPLSTPRTLPTCTCHCLTGSASANSPALAWRLASILCT